ncbi:MAG: NUDIX hydrolase, partial [Candidatus Limnocylindria bacterium]
MVVRSYKHGPRAVGLSLPAGYLDDGEEPLDAARRELREESGHEAEGWTSLGRFVVDGNYGC